MSEPDDEQQIITTDQYGLALAAAAAEGVQINRPAPTNDVAARYPFESGDVLVLGPECFIDAGRRVISYQGENYYARPAPTDDVAQALAALADERTGLTSAAPTDDVAALRELRNEGHMTSVATEVMERLAADLAAAQHALAVTHATMTRAQRQVAAVRALPRHVRLFGEHRGEYVWGEELDAALDTED